MARHVSVELIDDIDGSPAAETVDFGLDGVQYTIDLSTAHAAQLRSTLDRFVRKARELNHDSSNSARSRRRETANATEQIRRLAERAKDHHRARTAAAKASEEPIAPEAPETGRSDAEIVIAHTPPADKPTVALPLAPVFQPPQS